MRSNRNPGQYADRRFPDRRFPDGRYPVRPFPGLWGVVVGLALAVALVGCQGESQDGASRNPDDPSRQETAATGEKTGATAGKLATADGTAADPNAKRVDTPEAHAELTKELEMSRQQALAKREPVDPEVAARMKDPEYRKQKDDMLNRLSQITTGYYQDGVEIRHTRKRPEWRLIARDLASISDPAERKRKGEELAKRFKHDVEPVLEKEIGVKVFADASESIEIY